MDRDEFLRGFSLVSPFSAQLAEYLVSCGGETYGSLHHALRVGQAAYVDGPLRGTTVRAAFARAALLDQAARREFVEALGGPRPRACQDGSHDH